MEPSREILTEVWRRAVARCDAEPLARAAVAEARLPEGAWIVAMGKAAGPLAAGAVAALPGPPGRVVVAGGADAGSAAPAGAEILTGEHPAPGPGSFAAGRRLLEVAREARGAGAPVAALVSGGASSLCEVPAGTLTEAAVAELHRRLVASGAPISEVNLVRRHLSALKGGGLGRAFGATLRFVGVLADVPSGRVEDVASAPFTDTPFDPAAARRVLRRRLGPRTPPAVYRHLVAAEEGPPAASPFAGPPKVLADPSAFAAAAAAEARALGLGPVRLREATVDVPAEALVEELLDPLSQGGLWVAAGEAGVPVGDVRGRGGRASHLALAVWLAARERGLAGSWAFLAGASDGHDGGGGAGGAVDDRLGLDPRQAALRLAAFDSGGALEGVGAWLPAHPARTNLTDLFLAWGRRPSS